MAGYQLITKIGYVLIVLLTVSFMLAIYFSGLEKVTVEIDQNNEERYQAAAVLGNTLSIRASRSELGAVSEGYDYDRKRSLIPVEYFYHSASSGGIGYRKEGEHCYIERVGGLDGEEYGYYIQPASEPARELACTDTGGRGVPATTVTAPVILVQKAFDEPPVMARLSVYEIEE